MLLLARRVEVDANGAREEVWRLRYDCNLAAQRRQWHGGRLDAVESNAARLEVIEA